MYPILFKLGPVKIYAYGIMVATGFLIATLLAEREAKRENISGGLIMDLAIVIILSGLLGARFLYVVNNLDYFIRNPKEILMLTRGGLVFYGGAGFSVAASFLFLMIRRVPFFRVADTVIPYATLAHSLGRIGCFLNGCCWGKPTRMFLGVTFPQVSQAVHPTQLYEAISLFLLFLFLVFIKRRKKFNGQVFLSWLVSYSVIRFFIEFLRGDNKPVLIGLTLSQVISAIIFIIGIFSLYKCKEYERRDTKGV